MGTRPDKAHVFMEIAWTMSRLSTCARRAVGAVIVNDKHHIMSTGYNGPASGLVHCIDSPCPGAGLPSGTGLEACEAIHAEANALLQCPDVYSILKIFVTTAPCISCTKLLLNTSCQEIVFQDDYPQAEAAKNLWQKSSRIWTRMER